MTRTSTEQPEARDLAYWIAHTTDNPTAALIQSLHARVQELEAAQAHRAPLDAYSLRAIFKKLNANLDEEGWNFGDLVREVEAYHGITQEKQG